MASDTRVAVVIRPLDRLLTVVKVVVVAVGALAAATPVLVVLGRSFTLAGWFVGAGVLILGGAFAYGSEGRKLLRPVERRLALTRRRVAAGCNHDEWAKHDDHPLACMLTAEVFRAPVFQHDRQRKVVAELRDACRGMPAEDYWFVEGRSGSGKTRAALLLVQNLVRDRDLCELGDRCHLYDFADSDRTQDELVRKLRNPHHDGAVVLVDNFQLVRRDVLRTLTARLIDGSRSASERLLVFLARPGEAWSLGSGSDVRLLSEAKAKRHYLELTAPSSEAVATRVFDVDERASELIRDLRQDYVASATQLHLAQVIARNQAAPPEVIDLLRLLTDARAASAPPELVELVAVLSALAMHRGWFSRRELRRALREARRRRSRVAGLPGAARMRGAFRRLHKIGVVPKIHLNGTRYLFHESIAELCIDRLSSIPEFREPFVAVGRMRMRAPECPALDAWLVGAEIGDPDVVETSFDEALAQGAYGRMTRCLQRANNRYPLTAPTRLQLAILLDRTGDFDASREQFTEDLADALADSNELAAILATSRLEARHDETSARELQALRNHPDRLLAILGEYWELHVAAHHGRFAAQQMLDLASEALARVKGRESHWTTHSLGRMHFDSLRHHYLEGGLPADAIASNARTALNTYLSTRLPTFKAFHLLYARAHLVGHVLLPQVAIYKQPLSEQSAGLAQLDPADVPTIGALAAVALELYRQARDEFWQFGDREGRYLRGDVLNAAMIQDQPNLDALKEDLDAYQHFIGETGFKDIFSYPHFYALRWNLLKYYDVLARGNGDPHATDELLVAARHELERIVVLDTAVKNRYGLLRAELLELLLRIIEERKRPEVAELAELEARMAANGYGSEQRLLRHLAERESLTSADLRTIIRFYPFVHQ